MVKTAEEKHKGHLLDDEDTDSTQAPLPLPGTTNETAKGPADINVDGTVLPAMNSSNSVLREC